MSRPDAQQPETSARERAEDPTRVRFDAGYRRRLDTLVLRLDTARRRIEASGRAREMGVGEEWVGFRPYRPGDDPRRMDWQLLARLDRPFVRVTRREASERWLVLLDSSASMGLGRPAKLQAAAEVAAAWAAFGLRSGAEVRLRAAGRGEPPRTFDRPARVPELLAWFESLEAAGAHAAKVADLGPELDRAGRVLVLTDLHGDPSPRLFEVARRRRVAVVQVLAGVELDPPLGAVRLVDPETGRAHEVAVDERLHGRYSAELSRRLERWRVSLSRHGIAHCVHPATQRFEETLEAVVLGTRRGHSAAVRPAGRR
ncbi:MAG: DUF58 domain-containing protein [Planctomycetota bacterium]